MSTSGIKRWGRNCFSMELNYFSGNFPLAGLRGRYRHVVPKHRCNRTLVDHLARFLIRLTNRLQSSLWVQDNPKNNVSITEELRILLVFSFLLLKQEERSGEAGGYWPSSNVEGPVHDHDKLDVQPVPLCGVPPWFVTHEHRIQSCICRKEKNSTGEKENNKLKWC